MDMYFHLINRSGSSESCKGCFKKMAIILFCFFYTNIIVCSTVDVYKNDCFGYIIVNPKDKSLEIFKHTNELEGDDTLLASCSIIKNKKDYFVISSTNLFSEIINDINFDVTLKSENTTSCSTPIIIEAIIKKNENIKFNIFIDTCSEQKWMVAESENSRQIIYKSEVENELDCDYLHLFITPCVNPFSNYSSFADSQTISFIDLSIGDFVEVDLKDIMNLKIEIPETIYETYNRWVLNEEYVIKKNDHIFWRGMLFEKM